MLTPIILIAIACAVVWAITCFLPMPPKAKQVIWGVAGLLLLLYLRQSGLLNAAGIPPVIVDVVMAIALTGVFVWLVVTLVPMPEKFRVGILVIAGVLLLLWLLSYFGLFHSAAISRRR